MRLFIAVPLPKDIQRKVFAFEQELRAASTGGRFVPQGNHHITLRFIGESNDLADIAFAMDQAVADARPFTLKLGGYGWFDHGGARTSFLRAEGDLTELYRIHEMLETNLWERGFCKGKGRLIPHITLGRAVEHGDISHLLPPENASFRVNSIVLYESTNERGRMVYTPVHTARF